MTLPSRICLGLLTLCSLIPSCVVAKSMCPANGYPLFALGADVSWTPYIEENHVYTYYKGTTIADDQITNVPEMVSDYGIDAVRLRVWVDPKSEMAMSGFDFKVGNYTYDMMSTYGTCSPEEMTSLAKRFAERGQRLMIVFQLSDMWTDPARQFIPQSWSACNTAAQLGDKVYEHIYSVLTALRQAEVNVEWVQIGNEVNTGMLKYEVPASASGVTTVKSESFGCEISSKSDGSPTETTYNFVKVFNRGAQAAKHIYPQSKVVLHLANATKTSNVKWTIETLNKAGFSGGQCDYIGLSLYPGLEEGNADYTGKWKESVDKALETINTLHGTLGYRTLLCEFGMNNEYSTSANTQGVSNANLQKCYIDQCNADVRDCTEYLISHLNTADRVCDGLFYWEPETDYMKNYTKGACVSVNPGASWPRDKVTANAWWQTIKENSTFPTGGLKEFDIASIIPTPNNDEDMYLCSRDNEQRIPFKRHFESCYYIDNLAAAQWFNFKITNADGTLCIGDAAVGLSQPVWLNDNNDWFAWTTVEVPSNYTWWLRSDNYEFIINPGQDCPWGDLDAGIPAAEEDDAPIEYYNLQGLRVDKPSTGIYIVRQGAKSHKQVFSK